MAQDNMFVGSVPIIIGVNSPRHGAYANCTSLNAGIWMGTRCSVTDSHACLHPIIE